MPTPKEILADPNFQALPIEERRKVMLQVDPQGFGALPSTEQDRVFEIAQPPHRFTPAEVEEHFRNFAPANAPDDSAGFWSSLGSGLAAPFNLAANLDTITPDQIVEGLMSPYRKVKAGNFGGAAGDILSGVVGGKVLGGTELPPEFTRPVRAGGRFVRGAVQGGLEAVKERPLVIPALTGTGELLGGHRGAAIGSALGTGIVAIPAALKGGMEAWRKAPVRFSETPRTPAGWQGMEQPSIPAPPSLQPIVSTLPSGRTPGVPQAAGETPVPGWNILDQPARTPIPEIKGIPSQLSSGRIPGKPSAALPDPNALTSDQVAQIAAEAAKRTAAEGRSGPIPAPPEYRPSPTLREEIRATPDVANAVETAKSAFHEAYQKFNPKTYQQDLEALIRDEIGEGRTRAYTDKGRIEAAKMGKKPLTATEWDTVHKALNKLPRYGSSIPEPPK